MATNHPAIPHLHAAEAAAIAGEHRHVMQHIGRALRATQGASSPMAKAPEFIQTAIKRPGALHRATHTPIGEKIPAKKIATAERSETPRIAAEARFAATLKKINDRHTGLGFSR